MLLNRNLTTCLAFLASDLRQVNRQDAIFYLCASRNEYVTPDYISRLESKEIFVFGSNLVGFHGGGVARIAYERFGAEWGVGVGRTGHCYAIPTMHTVPLTKTKRKPLDRIE